MIIIGLSKVVAFHSLLWNVYLILITSFQNAVLVQPHVFVYTYLLHTCKSNQQSTCIYSNNWVNSPDNNKSSYCIDTIPNHHYIKFLLLDQHFFVCNKMWSFINFTLSVHARYLWCYFTGNTWAHNILEDSLFRTHSQPHSWYTKPCTF